MFPLFVSSCHSNFTDFLTVIASLIAEMIWSPGNWADCLVHNLDCTVNWLICFFFFTKIDENKEERDVICVRMMGVVERYE